MSAGVIAASYVDSAPVSPTGDVVSTNLINLTTNYEHSFVLPSGVAAGDLMLVGWSNYHPWTVNTAGGWVTDYDVGSGRVVCHKFITTEVAGDTVHASLTGSGFRAAGQMVIVRGADLSAPINSIAIEGASISAGAADRLVIYMVEQGSGGPDPTLSRGVEIQHAVDTLAGAVCGVRASQEVVPAGGTVTCTSNTFFLASLAIKAA